MSFEARLAQANGRLKAGKVGVTIEVRGGRLCLRAIFPPRPSSLKPTAYQQRLTLNYHANPAGLKLAEQKAREVGLQLESGSFDWAKWGSQKVKTDSCKEWILKFEEDYFTRRKRTPKSETTWRYDYLKVFSELPENAPLTLELLGNVIRSKPADSRTRKRFVDVCTRLAKFAGLEPKFEGLKGNYSPAKVTPRNLPTDEAIAEWREKIPNSAWRRAYSLIAVYGLRPHEVFKSDLSEFPLVQVQEDTKTGERFVYPLYPEWAENWDLVGDLPQVTGKTNTDLGQRVTKAFERYKLPFSAYCLRHKWAVRAIEFGLDIPLAAAQMGHSVKVHCEIYHAWISNDIHERAYRILLSNPNRPKAPGLDLSLNPKTD